MTSRVPGSSPGGSGGFFSLFRQFTSPTDTLNLKFSQSFPKNIELKKCKPSKTKDIEPKHNRNCEKEASPTPS